MPNKVWKDFPDTSTPLDADALNKLESNAQKGADFANSARAISEVDLVVSIPDSQIKITRIGYTCQLVGVVSIVGVEDVITFASIPSGYRPTEVIQTVVSDVSTMTGSAVLVISNESNDVSLTRRTQEDNVYLLNAIYLTSDEV